MNFAHCVPTAQSVLPSAVVDSAKAASTSSTASDSPPHSDSSRNSNLDSLKKDGDSKPPSISIVPQDQLKIPSSSEAAVSPPQTSATSSPHISYEGRLSFLHAPSSYSHNAAAAAAAAAHLGFLSRDISIPGSNDVTREDDDEDEDENDHENEHKTSSTKENGKGEMGLGLSSPNRHNDSLERLREICNKNIPITNLNRSIDNDSIEEIGGPNESPLYQCHLCTYTGISRDDFNAHVNGHYEFKCQKCDFTTKEENLYRIHLKEEHNLTPEDLEDEQGIRVPRVNSQGKVKTFKCKQCEFVAVTKEDFWAHTKSHIKPEKMLTCPKCPFVTEYKHHLEYHLRNHFGSKPYKCRNCNYSCVNKSMLNSHMKSHTNIYQYRCQDCTYATKYCHSLKLHLRKYAHKPAMVLNQDGTPNPLPIIDIYGTRRGPKVTRKDEVNNFPQMLPTYVMAQMQMQQQLSTSLPNLSPSPSRIAQVPPFSITNNFNDALRNLKAAQSPLAPHHNNDSIEKCHICNFETPSREIFENHMALHATKEREVDTDLPFGMGPTGGENRLRGPGISPNKEVIEDDEDGDENPPQPEKEELARLEYLDYFRRLAPAILQQQHQQQQQQKSFEINQQQQTVSPVAPQISQIQNQSQSNLPHLGSQQKELFSRLYFEKMLKSLKTEKDAESLNNGNGNNNSNDNGNGNGTSAGNGHMGGHGFALDLSQSPNNPDLDVEIKEDEKPSSSVQIESNRFVRNNRKKGTPTRIVVTPPEPIEEVQHTNGKNHETNNYNECRFCEIMFKDPIMHNMHMGYHGYQNPFKCNMCGDELNDKISFFLHIAKKAHNS